MDCMLLYYVLNNFNEKILTMFSVLAAFKIKNAGEIFISRNNVRLSKSPFGVGRV